MKPPDHEIISDGKTVWVNTGWGLIGRFGPNGIDVHRPMLEQEERGECLHCTHEPTSRADWDVFVEKMLEHWGVEVPADIMPTKFARP